MKKELTTEDQARLLAALSASARKQLEVLCEVFDWDMYTMLIYFGNILQEVAESYKPEKLDS